LVGRILIAHGARTEFTPVRVLAGTTNKKSGWCEV
jgi:hypothetical protein